MKMSFKYIILITLTAAAVIFSCAAVNAATWESIASGPIVVTGGGSGIPTVDSVNPNSGSSLTTTNIIINGSGFSGVTAVRIGNMNIQSYTVTSTTTITATVQSGLTPGLYHITVTNAFGTSAQTWADVFTVTTNGLTTVVIDDYEGTDRSYYNAGTSLPTYAKDTAQKHEGIYSMKVRYNYSSGWGGMVGGYLPFDMDLRSTNGVFLWLKGDGSNNPVRLDLVETMEGIVTGETYSSPPIILAGTGWHKIEIPYTKFSRNEFAYIGQGANGNFSRNIRQYQLVYTGTGAPVADHYVDYIVASADVSSDNQPPSNVEGVAMAKSDYDLILGWNPATDNIGVVQYNIYRGTTPGFTCTSANLWGISPTISFNDAGALGSTQNFYYKVKAQDGSFNESLLPSNMGFMINYVMTKNYVDTNIRWLSLPYISPYKKASDIGNDIKNVTSVTRYVTASDTYESLVKIAPSLWVGNDFNIVTGESYAVIISADATAQMVGWFTPYTIQMPYFSGKTNTNWLSVPYNATYTKASEMAPTIPNATKVSRFNPATQDYEELNNVSSVWSGTDFNIIPGEGYRINISAGSSWTPSTIN